MTTASYSDTATSTSASEAVADPGSRRHWLPAVLHGREGDPRWIRPSLLAILLATGVLYLWGLGASGYANSFYSAAVQAGAHSWKAFLFGSLDSSNFITVDKPPASLWVMDISARIFGVNSWSILVPQAMEGIASVGLLYLAVRRRFSAAAGLLAAVVLALTPVATLMFRFNNPDALLVLLMVGAAYAVVRAMEAGRTRWLVLAGALLGLGFLTKMLQALLVVPGFALTYLLAAPTSLRRRLISLLAGGAAMIAATGWWIAIASLWPAASRPYIGGSQHNSILELVFGYNGFGRLTGNETGSVGGGGGTASRWGATGLTRLFNSEMGGQIAWLIPAALLLFVAMLWLTRREDRTGGRRASVLLWGSWLVITGITFSLAKGIIHPYYPVALAPAVAALVGIGAVSLWEHRDDRISRLLLSLAMAITAVWSYELLNRTPTWHPALRSAIVIVGMVAAVALVGVPWLGRRALVPVAAAAVLTGLAGPAAYSIATAATAHTGAIPSAGPTVAASFGGGTFGQTGGQGAQGNPGFGGTGTAGGTGAQGTPPQLGSTRGGTGTTGGTPSFGGNGAGSGGLGGLLDSSTPSAAMQALLNRNASSYTWVAATVGANNAAGYQLATGHAVMAIGGFNGTDPTPTLAQFKAYVTAGKIHYFVPGGTGGGTAGSSSSTSSQITGWVESHYTAKTVDGTTVYDLTAPSS